MFEDGIEKGEGDAQWLAPESVCFEMGFDINKKRTFQRAIIEETEFRRCVACRKSYMDPRNKPRRREFARKTLEERPTKEDFRDIRYSDEVHVGYGPQGRMYVYRKPG
jgi:hypothetical protein